MLSFGGITIFIGENRYEMESHCLENVKGILPVCPLPEVIVEGSGEGNLRCISEKRTGVKKPLSGRFSKDDESEETLSPCDRGEPI